MGPFRAPSFYVSILLASSPTLCLASPVPTQLLRCRTAPNIPMPLLTLH